MTRGSHAHGARVLALALLMSGVSEVAQAQEAEPPADDSTRAKPDTAMAEPDSAGSKVRVRYNEGLEVSTYDGNWRLHVEGRFQFRFSYPFDENVNFINNINELILGPAKATFEIQRARLRVGGHAYRPWIDYYLEFDLVGPRLLSWRFTFSPWQSLQGRVGQWEVFYNRERKAPDRELQLVDRSIINDFFSIDLQQGLTALGTLWPGKTGESRYWAGVFSGNGRAAGNDDAHLMWQGRYQWNFLGSDPGLGQADLEVRERAAASIAVAGVTNRSPCTAFSTGGGCSELPGFEPGEAGQYSVRQLMGEYAFKHLGFATQGEFHWKRIDDNVNLTRTELVGGYVQAGYLLHGAIAAIPRPLELAAQVAFVDPDQAVSDDSLREYTFGLNWYFAGYRNRLSADASLFSSDEAGDRWRFRIQWDISF